MVAAEVTEKEGSLALPILPAFTTDCGGEPVHQDAYAARIMPGSISEFVPQLSAFIIKVWLVPVQPLTGLAGWSMTAPCIDCSLLDDAAKLVESRLRAKCI